LFTCCLARFVLVTVLGTYLLASKTFNMEYGVQLVRPYSPRRLSRYLYDFVQNTQTMQDASTWMTTLTCLKSQKRYLDDLLTKTATTLNALRDKQGRNDCLLSATFGPRSKKKKLLQNRWRTDKTIKTCENEEKAILDCLKVCENNMHTLESIVYPIPVGICTTAAEYNSGNSEWSYTEPATTNFEWNGWTDDGTMSPFHRQRQGQYALIMLDEIPPEAHVHEPERPPPLRSSVQAPPSAKLLSVPPNTALPRCRYSVLRPEATSFEPHMTHSATVERRRKELDKLSTSVASNHMSQIQGRPLSDGAIRHVFQRRSVKNWSPTLKQHDTSVSGAATAALVKRTRSA
jgi:hypothetical protein